MDNKKTTTIIMLGLVAIAGILLFLLLPSKSQIADIDFYVYDTNDNFHYEVNERLELLVNDTAAIKGKRLIWEMGNGDTLMRNRDVSYTYRKAGRYLITLKVDEKHSINKYIRVISVLERETIDSIPRIHGVSEGYQGEELVFSAEGEGMDAWQWEFGESGTVDAYERQVVYSYDFPGEYTISLQTNTTKYPVKHRITILSRFEKAEELVTVDSLVIAQNDIKKHLQAIADADVSQKSAYYEHTNYIRNKYFCVDADRVVVIVNDEKYNDFDGYCQGLHFLESNRKKPVSIDDVKIDDLNCVKSIHVTQSYVEK